MLKWHLIGSAICWYAFLIIYGQILFSVVKVLYKYSGLLFIFILLPILGFNAISTTWLLENKWDKTRYYALAATSNGLQFILVLFVLILAIIVFWWAPGQSKDDIIRVKGQIKPTDGKQTEIPLSRENKRDKDGEKWNNNKGKEEGKI